MPSFVDIGNFINRVVKEQGGVMRTPEAVAGRTLEEVVEMCLEAGLDAAQIQGHVADSIHNQCLKASINGRTVFPSQLRADPSPEKLLEEICDVSLLLGDLCFVAGFTEDQAIAGVAKKFEVLKSRDLRVNDKGLVYRVASHVKT